MEWNAKSLGQWDWEHLFFLNAKATENPRLSPWGGDTDREINVGVLYPSASNNSSSNEDSKTSMLTQEGPQDDSTGKKELSKVEPVEPSALSGEPLLTLKLGKRFYFEDVCAGSDSKKSSFSAVAISYGKKCKSSSQNLLPPSCQVEGCGLDLSSAKDYHRKHRVCESHSKSPLVVIAGLERRFCQQCSRFHDPSEFDAQKRSCRRRLSDHNARRRKPQPQAVQLNPSTLSSSPYDGRQVMGPFAFSRNATNLAWHEQDMHSNKIPQTKDFILKPTKALHKIPNMLSDDSSGLLTSKGIGTNSTVPGIEDATTLPDPNATQDVNRALSLLSTNPWGACEPKFHFLQHSNRTTSTQSTTQRLPLPPPEYWHSDQQPASSSTCVSYSDYDNSDRFQDFQLFNTPFESGFPCNRLD